MKKTVSIFLTFIFAFYFALPTCAKQIQVAKSQLEVREIQTHVYDTSDTQGVFKAAINTLQDEGYTILNIEDELGYIQAKREFKAVRIDKKRLTCYYVYLALAIADTALSYGIDCYLIPLAIKKIHNETDPRTIIVNSNVNIEPYGKKTRIRFTLVEKELENADGYSYIKSSPRKVIRYYAAPVYQEFFGEMDKSIFYDKNKV